MTETPAARRHRERMELNDVLARAEDRTAEQLRAATAEPAVGPHQFVRFLTGPDATPPDICHCGADLFDPVHPDWPPTETES